MPASWRRPACWPLAVGGEPAPAALRRERTLPAQAHRRIFEASAGAEDEGRGLDAEWLCDNFHIIEEVLREVHQDLPQGYDAELPKLSGGPLHGYPRVYALALALVAHTDSELDEARLIGFVQAFQEVTPLADRRALGPPHDAAPGLAGEPAPPLRADALEAGRAPAGRPLGGGCPRRRAAPARGARGRSRGRGARSPGEATDPYVVRLLQLFRDHDPRSAAALVLLEAELDLRGIDANEVLRREHGRQAGNQVSVGNCVISLRLLSALDWNVFFERCSAVEAILREDPSGVYPLQDFPTRDRYRKAVEEIARGADADERPSHAMRWSWRATPPMRARRGACRLLPRRPRPGRLEGEVRLSRPLARMARPPGLEAPQGDVFRVDGRPPGRS